MTLATGKAKGRRALTHSTAPKRRSELTLSEVEGLTFIEVLFVVIIIGILIGVSFPNFRKTFNSLQLNSTSYQLRSFMDYLRERAIIEKEVIFLSIDTEKNEFGARLRSTQNQLKAFTLPEDIELQTDKKEVLFYPDGSIDSAVIRLINPDKESAVLNMQGGYGRVKLEIQQ